MSVTTMALVFNAEIPNLKYTKKGKERTAKASTVTLVLLAYADHANENGEGTYPGYKRLIQKTKLSAQGLADTIEALKQNEVLTLQGRSKLNTNSYSINIDKIKGFVKPLEKQESSHLSNKVKPLEHNHPSTNKQPTVKEGAKRTPEKPKPLKANQIPQIILFREVTRRYPAKGSQFTVITSVDKVGDRLGQEATAEDLEPFYREWCDRGYNPVSVKWLSEWAVSGNIPQRVNGNGSKPTQPKGMTVAQSWLEKRQAANG